MGLVLTSPISIGGATAATSFVEVPGMDGSLDLSLRNAQGAAYFGRRDITLQLATVGTFDEVARARSILGYYNGQDVYVFDARFGGEWHGTLTLGEWVDHVESWDGQISATVTATVAAEPTLLMLSKAVEFAPRTQASDVFSVSIAGNRATWPTFVLTPNRTSTVIGVRVEDASGRSLGSARYSQLAVISDTFVIDCERSLVTSGGEMKPVSIMEDFPALVPGVVRITPIGCSSATMSYRSRVML